MSTEYVILCTVYLCLMLYSVQNKAGWSQFKVTSQLDFILYNNNNNNNDLFTAYLQGSSTSVTLTNTTILLKMNLIHIK